MENFIRSKPALAKQYDLLALLRRRVYEPEVDGSWGLEEFAEVRVCACPRKSV